MRYSANAGRAAPLILESGNCSRTSDHTPLPEGLGGHIFMFMNENGRGDDLGYLSSEKGRRILEVIGYVLADGGVSPMELGRVIRALGDAEDGEPEEISSARAAFGAAQGRANSNADLASLHMHLLAILPSPKKSEAAKLRTNDGKTDKENEQVKEREKGEAALNARRAKAVDRVTLSLEGDARGKDKFYEFLLEETENGLYTVSVFFGRKGGVTKESKAKKQPVALEQARGFLTSGVCYRLQQGYTVDGMTEDEVRERFRFSRAEGALVTTRQLQYIKNLGGVGDPSMTRAEASAYIDILLRKSNSDKPSVRQRAVLRFWGKDEMGALTRDEISDWMDDWYDEDPKRIQAWEIWKRRIGDDGLQNPELVSKTPCGQGFLVLREMEGGEAVPGLLARFFGFR